MTYFKIRPLWGQGQNRSWETGEEAIALFSVSDNASRPGCARRNNNTEMNSTLPSDNCASKWMKDSSPSPLVPGL